MRIRLTVLALTGILFTATRSDAQFNVPDPAPGEEFVVELGVMLWQPTPEIRIQTGALTQITGGEVDFVEEFDIEDKRFTEFRAVLKPGRKHKIRFSYLPIRYEAETTLERTIVFGGRTFTIGVPAAAELKWDMWRFGYEFDFIARDRGFVGVIGELKYNKVSADLSAATVGAEFYEANAPVPGLGLIGRGYPHENFSITAEFTGFKVPDSVSEEFEASLYDFDVYGTLSFTRNVAVQGGYRSVTADYLVEEDAGDLKMKGLYFGGVVRF